MEHFILVLNSGSSTVKYSLFEIENLTLKEEGKKERIGLKGGLPNYEEAIQSILDSLLEEKVRKTSQIKAVGHRIVHGGEDFKEPTLINEEAITKLKRYSELAPLHNPPNVLGVETATELLPEAKQVAVFDTAFHSTISKENFLYAIPYDFYEKHGIKRYGFHGISHQYVSEKSEEILEKKIGKLVSVHLGSGCSITAIQNGNSINTSMGFTPLEGLVMGTRSGNIDPAIVPYLIRKLNLESKEVERILNEESGCKGICGSKDFRDILKKKDNDKKSKLAYDIFKRSVVQFIGKYVAEMNGVDVISFTAGIGEGSWELRKDVIDHFEFLGVELDSEKNKNNEQIISRQGSKVKVLVVHSDEALKIAQEVSKLIK